MRSPLTLSKSLRLRVVRVSRFSRAVAAMKRVWQPELELPCDSPGARPPSDRQ
jgi:hypothetical protein